MSKDKDEKINIAHELTRKQIFDCTVLFFAFAIVYACAKLLNYDAYNLAVVLLAVFILVIILLEFSKTAVKSPLNEIVMQAIRENSDNVVTIQKQNKNQKENNLNTSDKVKSLQVLCESADVLQKILKPKL